MKSCVWAAMHPRIIDNAVVQWRQGLRACLQAENTSRKQEEDILNIFFNSIYHINLIARKCYYQLRQLRVVSRSLTHQSRLTLVHAFVTNRIDCCCSLLAVLPLATLARLDRVLRSAARLVGGLSKFSSITAYMRDVLHWLPISERIQYRITAMVSRCVLGCAPSYL